MNSLMLLIFGTDLLLKLFLVGCVVYWLRKAGMAPTEHSVAPGGSEVPEGGADISDARATVQKGLSELEEEKSRLLKVQEEAFQQLMSYDAGMAYGLRIEAKQGDK